MRTGQPFAVQPVEAALRARVREAIDAMIGSAATRFERRIAIARLVFFAAVLIRFVAVSHPVPLAALTTVGTLSGAILYSTGVLWFLRAPPKGQALWMTSVTVDALTCFGALVPNALWPGPHYVGILEIPDTVGILVAVVTAGFRLSAPAALLGGALNVAGLFGLVAVDRWVSGPRFVSGAGALSAYLIYIAAFALLAVILAWGARRLVREGALAALAAERAERGLGSVLGRSHDLSNRIARAVMRADVVSKGLAGPDAARAAQELAQVAAQLADDVERIGELVIGLKRGALDGVPGAAESPAIAGAAAVAAAVAQARARYPDLSVAIEPPAVPAMVRMAGGAPTLQRLLLDLLGLVASRSAERSGVRVRIAFADDDESASVHILFRMDDPVASPSAPEAGRSGDGSAGAGGFPDLSAIRGRAEASGGSFRLVEPATGGTELILALPRADEDDAAAAGPAP